MKLLSRAFRKIIISPAEKFILYICRLFYKVDDKLIVFETEGDFWDNGRVFYDYLISNKYNKKYRIVWFVHDPKKYKHEENVEFISRFNYWINWRAMKVLAQGKCFLFTHPWWFKNWKKDQVVINLTHSTMQLKAGGADVSDSFDYILCASEAAKNIKKITYHISDSQAVILGSPRNDLLNNKIDFGKIIENYNNEKVFLSMVTFKQSATDKIDSKKLDYYSLNVVNSQEEMRKLNTYLSDNKIILIVKIHHIQDVSFLKKEHYSNILYLFDSDLEKKGIQLYEVLGNVEVLLTDYSSVFYDYLFVDKPIGFLIDDLNNYNRGFCVDNPLEHMPGEKIYSLDDLLKFFDNVLKGKDDYKEKRKALLNEVHYYKINHCERLLKWLQTNVFKENINE